MTDLRAPEVSQSPKLFHLGVLDKVTPLSVKVSPDEFVAEIISPLTFSKECELFDSCIYIHNHYFLMGLYNITATLLTMPSQLLHDRQAPSTYPRTQHACQSIA